MSTFDINVIIVEDDIMVMKILLEFMSKSPHVRVVGKAHNLDEAKRIISMQQVNLIFLDVFLPDGKGTDLLKWIRHENYLADIIMITADQSASTIKEALSYGALDYLVKPVRLENIQASITRYKEKSQKLKEASKVEVKTIDQLFNHTDEENNMQNQTLTNIKGFLMDHPGNSYSSTEIANELGISRITARKYLELMESTGEIDLELSYGSIGRPKNKYVYKGDQ